MTLVNESTGHGTRTRVQIFIRAPDSEVDIPIVQMKFEISRRMREIETDDRTDSMADFRYGLHVERLPGVVVHASKQHKRDLVTMNLDGLDDVFGSKRRFAIAGREF